MARRSRRRYEALRIAGACSTAVAATLLGSLPARAESAKPVVVVWTEGPDGERVRADVSSALGGSYQVVSPADWRGAVTRLGGDGGSLEGSLRDRRKRDALVGREQRAAVEAHVSDVVLVWSTHTRHHHSAEVLVIDAAHGAASPVHVGDLRKVGATARDEVTLAHPPGRAAPSVAVAPAAPLAQPVAPAMAPPAATSAAATSATLATGATGATSAPLPAGAGRDDRDRPLTWSAGSGERDRRDAASGAGSVTPRPLHVVGRELLDVSVSGGAGTRNFAYSGATSGNLRSYSMNGAPMFGLQGSIYPLADAHLPVLSDLGVVLGFQQAFALQSSAADAGTQSTRWVRALAGGRFRLPTGSGHAPILGLTGAYESEGFTFSSSSAAGSGTVLTGAYPSVSYQAVVVSLDARVPLGRFAILAQGGYLDVLSAGNVASDFPHAKVAGVEGELGAALAIVDGLEARLVADYHRYFYSLGTTPGDTLSASGATDQMWNAQARLAYTF